MAVSKTKVDNPLSKSWVDRAGPPFSLVTTSFSDLADGSCSMPCSLSQKTAIKRLGHDTEDFEARCDEYKLTPEQTKDLQGKWAQVTFKIVISYLGKSFDGWQKQPGLDTVQGLIESSIGRFIDDHKAEQLKDKGLSVEGLASVAGRTDKGVTALNQADFKGFIAEIPSSAPISVNKQIELWLRATKGLRNGRILTLGELGASLVRSGLINELNDISCSSMLPQENLEPLKEEIMEVWDEIKALQAQNKELKDMLALLVQKVQGGASTSQ